MSTTRGEVRAGPPALPAPGARSVVSSVAGVPWWASILLGLVPTLAGVAVDLLRTETLGLGYLVAFPLGCVVATAAARRSELFVPMVQPPLVVAFSVPVVVVASGSLPASGGTLATVLAVGGPLINGFPAMAVTTAVCLALGWARIALQERPRPGDGRAGRSAAARPGAERSGARRSGPQPSAAAARTDRVTGRPRREARTERVGSERVPDDRTTRRTTELRPRAPGPAGPAGPPGPAGPAPGPPVAGPPGVGGDPLPRRSPLVLPPEDDPPPAAPSPGGPGEPRPGRSREDRMRTERIRQERRREARRPDGPRGGPDEPPRPER